MRPSASRGQWAPRLAARVYVWLVLGLCVVAALELVRGHLVQAVVPFVALAADFVGLAALVAGIVVCLLAGVPAAALLATAMLATRLAARGGLRLEAERRRREGADLEALAAATVLPDDLREAVPEGGPVTTRTMLVAALAADPGRWRPLLGADPGEGAFDGTPVAAADGVECSQYAAEALGFGSVLAERLHRPLGVDLLGACAVLIPDSAAARWLDPGADREDLTRATVEQLSSAMAAYAESPAGADLIRRVEDAARSGSPTL